VRETGNLPVPLHLRNAPTRLMKELGYGAKAAPGANRLPEILGERRYLRQ
jgi:replication-associated recombination protein RarA